ncbi:MAG: dTDP-4-dehydrorhamnose 3,5-epimerase [Alphaproteobacteria bacterium]
MNFLRTPLDGVYVVEPARIEDERGFFARSWCKREFAEHGLEAGLAQCSISFNRRAGTLRGLHFQAEPFAETKLVRCTRGAIWDVVVDLRWSSPTYGHWTAAELSADNRRMTYIPPGFAHGFQTLADDSEVFYQISEFHEPEASRGIRWDDGLLAIDWPTPPGGGDRIISDKDRALPGFAEGQTPRAVLHPTRRSKEPVTG